MKRYAYKGHQGKPVVNGHRLVGVIDHQARLRWSVEKWAQWVENSRRLETQLDVELARAKQWSREWWRIVKELDRVRNELIEDGGI